MKTEKLERGNEIQKRLKELEKVQAWMEDERRNIYLLAQGCTSNESIKLSQDARTVMCGLAIGEQSRLQKEFDNL